VTVAQGETVTISRVGDAVAVDGVACDTATVTNTETIDVLVPAVPESDTVVIELLGGALAPGETDEADGSSEIEIDITGTQAGDKLRVVGSAGPDAFAAESLSANLNSDESFYDNDVTVDGPTSLELLGGEGDDLLALEGFGPNLFGASTVMGGPGDDRVTGDLGGADGDAIDAGPGRDVADYSYGDELNLVWEPSGDAFFFENSQEDDVANAEVAVLTDGIDTVAYVGDASGETWTGPDADSVHVIDPVPGGSPEDRIVHGGPGTFDSIQFDSSPGDPAIVELSGHTIGGSWDATHHGFEYISGDLGDDRFRVDRRGAYPTIVGDDGNDVVDLRDAVEGISFTMGQDTFGTRRWLRAFEVERVVGSRYNDVLLGPAGAAADDPVAFRGSSGRDQLHGGMGPDFLLGGAGSDTLRGYGGADTLRGWLGADLLEGGSGPDVLHGGPGNDVLRGGPGVDTCGGGSGADVLSSC
jgi:Ca2+-binding RTX toxin-like protein